MDGEVFWSQVTYAMLSCSVPKSKASAYVMPGRKKKCTALTLTRQLFASWQGHIRKKRVLVVAVTSSARIRIDKTCRLSMTSVTTSRHAVERNEKKKERRVVRAKARGEASLGRC